MNNDAFMRYECFNCGKGFNELDNGVCPYCHSDNFVDDDDLTNEPVDYTYSGVPKGA